MCENVLKNEEKHPPLDAGVAVGHDLVVGLQDGGLVHGGGHVVLQQKCQWVRAGGHHIHTTSKHANTNLDKYKQKTTIRVRVPEN